MAPTRKRRSRSKPDSSEVVASGGGTQSDVNNLAKKLGLESDAVSAILNCEGSGVASSRSSRSSAPGVASGTAPVASSAWSDFMTEEGFGVASASASSGGAAGASTSAATSTKNTTAEDTSAKKESGKMEGDEESASAAKRSRTEKSSSNANPDPSGKRAYDLPILTRMRPPSQAKNADDKYIVPGILAQTGTLDSKIVGRTKRTLNQEFDLQEPTILCNESIFGGQKVAFVATSSSAVHSIVITENGDAYTWGRNEAGQCGLSNGSTSSCVPLPVKIGLEGKFVGAALGKAHSILIEEGGTAYAVGNNKYGQCGVNTSVEAILSWRKCSVVGKASEAKIVQAACGENFSVLLDSDGFMYSAGLAEFGQLGNGETGEYFIAANKIGFANDSKFERRSVFVWKSDDYEDAKKPCGPLPDSDDVRIGSIACGKNHTIAVEAPLRKSSTATNEPQRVFSWGCGGYGVLGHGVQKDEYTPRLLNPLTGPIFKSNSPVRVAAGTHCSMALTENGHVYYCGKHRSVGEATMRPALVDVLANNMHVVTAFDGGGMTVFCSTQNGVTVSWGNGQMGELGYGINNPKSSSKPKFVEKLDSVIICDVSCGYGHTLMIICDEDEEDKKAIKKVSRIETDDLKALVKKCS